MAVPGDIKAGNISKPYGLQGEVNMILIPAAAKHIRAGNPLFIELDGQRVPFFIQSADLIAIDQAIVDFEFVDSLEEAKKLSGCTVYLDPKNVPSVETDEEDLRLVVGYRVLDQKLGDLGKVTEYMHSEMNPVWLIKYMGKEVMVPATHEFVQKMDHKKQILHLDLPEGITEL